MLSEFENILNLSLTLGTALENILVALICSLILATFYKYSYRGPGYSVSFIHSLVLLSLITAVVIMVIGNNLARAFGLVGAMSIIRFRTPIKDAMDIVYIFFSLAIGMAAGVGLHQLALAGTLIIGIVSLLLTKLNFLSPKKKKYLLQFLYSGSFNDNKEGLYVSVIKKYCKKFSLINVKSIGDGDQLEISYFVDIKDIESNESFVAELRSISGVSNVSLYFDEETF